MSGQRVGLGGAEGYKVSVLDAEADSAFESLDFTNFMTKVSW